MFVVYCCCCFLYYYKPFTFSFSLVSFEHTTATVSPIDSEALLIRVDMVILQDVLLHTDYFLPH